MNHSTRSISSFCVAVTTLLAAVVCASAPRTALADALPSFVAVPSGYTVGATTYRRYDHFEITVPDPAHPNANQHLKPAGHYWLVQLGGNSQAPTLAAWQTALEHGGWRVPVSQGLLVAQRGSPGALTWLKYSGGLRFEVVAETPLTPLTLPAPAATPETITSGQDLPYLPPLPGMSQSRFRIDAVTPEEMTGPLTGGPFYVGPPVTRIDYHGSTEISGLEVQAVYSAGLIAAGWTINITHEAGLTIAHYAQHGRDIWLSVYGVNGEMHVVMSDIGANASAARLRDALARDGHVALYGIYFDVDRDVLRPDSDATLQQILALLRADATLQLEVQGHTDNTGAPDHNQTLSEARAASVVRWLTAHGVAAARLTSAGYGATRPVADNRTPQGRALNRRVELARRGAAGATATPGGPTPPGTLPPGANGPPPGTAEPPSQVNPPPQPQAPVPQEGQRCTPPATGGMRYTGTGVECDCAPAPRGQHAVWHCHPDPNAGLIFGGTPHNAH